MLRWIQQHVLLRYHVCTRLACQYFMQLFESEIPFVLVVSQVQQTHAVRLPLRGVVEYYLVLHEQRQKLIY